MTEHPDAKSRPKIVMVNRAIVKDAQNRFIIVQRSKNDDFMPGKWELPGGKLEIGQDITTALKQEVKEETNLEVDVIDKIVYWDSKIIESGKYAGLPYIVLVGSAKAVGDISVEISHEHDDFAWVTIAEALKYDLFYETKDALETISNPTTLI